MFLPHLYLHITPEKQTVTRACRVPYNNISEFQEIATVGKVWESNYRKGWVQIPSSGLNVILLALIQPTDKLNNYFCHLSGHILTCRFEGTG